MFHEIPSRMLARMRELEEIDRRDRADGTPHSRRLRSVPPETGKFIALLAASAPPGEWIEVGTSAGYSTLWLALAAREAGGRVITYEIDAAKIELARATFVQAGVAEIIELVHGDALANLAKHSGIGFCFLDAEKDTYQAAYDLVLPRMVTGGLLVADNAISHESELRPMLDFALHDERVDAVLVPIGMGDLVCRKR
jgi:predicted O-methyltransferase YrrM